MPSDPIVIDIEEYGTALCQIPTRLIDQLVDVAGDTLTIKHAKGLDAWFLEANHFVGTIKIDDLHIYIRPKIGIQNVLALMECGSFPKWHLMRHLPVTVDKGLLTAVCQLFTLHLGKLLEQGLQKGYSDHESRSNPLRGRIDFTAFAKKPWEALPAPCRYQEYDANTPLNELLLMALERLVVMELPETLTRQTSAFLRFFGEVARPTNEGECLRKAVDWQPSHIDKHYEPAIRLAILILQKTSLNSTAGWAPMSTFLIDMNPLVEDFIRWGINANIRHPLSLLDKESSYLYMDLESRVRLKPDLVFRRFNKNALVADVKYKSKGGFEEIANSDVYQLASYCTALGLSRGVLITCLAKNGVYDTINLRNAQTQLAVYPVNLGVPSELLPQELERLAIFLTEQASLGQLVDAA